MKTILIITDKNKSSTAVTEACNEWKKEYALFVVPNEKNAGNTIGDEDVDLLVCDFSCRPGVSLQHLQQLIAAYPYIPCIAIIDPKEHSADDFLGNGINVCFEIPFQNDELYRWATKLLDLSSSGTIRGLPTHSILQMLESENKTCSLKVHTSEDIGYLYLERGELIAAELDTLRGEDAAYAIIAAHCHLVEIKFYNMQRQREISKSLMSLVMEAFRLKDEQESLNIHGSHDTKPRLELKHFFTTDTPLQLDQGLTVKLEQEEEKGKELISAELIGIHKDEYIILNRPKEYDETIPEEKKKQLVIKYLQAGRLCMFKTTPIYQIEKPEPLLFLAYPAVVHYHELRQAKRANIYVPCIMALASGPRHSSVLMDVSKTGCLCQYKTDRNKPLPEIEINETAFLYCLFPGVSEEQEINGVIRNVKKEKGEIRVGIEFTELPEEISKVIDNYLESLL